MAVFKALVDLGIQAFLLITLFGSVQGIPAECLNRSHSQERSPEFELYERKFQRYRGLHWLRPVKDPLKPIEVLVKLGVFRLIEISERNQRVLLNGFIATKWYDEIHAWNDTFPLNCVDSVVIPPGKVSGVWVPELAIINADSKYSVTANKEELVRIASDGYTSFAPGGMIEFLCNLDLSLFPFDTQICTIHMEAWRYPESKVIFNQIIVEKFDMPEHEQWYVLNITGKKLTMTYSNGMSFSIVHFSLHLKRKYSYYMLTVIQPCLLIAAIEIVSFAIHYGKGIRLEVSFTCLLAFMVFHTLVVTDLPKSADRPPLLMILITILTYLIGFAIFFQSVTLFLAGKAEAALTYPPKLAFVIAKRLAPFVMISTFQSVEAENNAESKDSLQRNVRNQNREAWHFVARTVDRYSCFIFVTLFVLACVATLVIIPMIL